MTHPAARLAALLLAGFLCIGMMFSIREGMVAVLWKGVHGNVSLWLREKTSAKLDAWQRVKDFADDAVRWDPLDPQLLQTSAMLYWWGAWKYLDEPDFSSKLADNALALYRRSIRARPAWPDAWLSLATVKNWRAEWDDEFQHAYQMAWQFGAWREQVILQSVELGFDAWKRFSPENREIFYQALHRAALRDPNWLRRTAAAKGATYIVCLVLRDHQPTRGSCLKQGYLFP
jgi:hypothetical protein